MIEGDPQSVVDELAARLERSVVVNDAGVRLLWASRHFGDEDPVRIRAVLQRDAGPEVAAHVLSSGVADWRTDGVIPAHPGLGLTARRCVPIRVGDELVAMLLVIDADDTLSGEELALMHAAGTAVGRLLDAGAQRRSRAALEEEVSAFLGVDAAGRAGAQRRLEAAGTWSGAPRTRVAVVGPRGAAGGHERLRSASRPHRAAGRLRPGARRRAPPLRRGVRRAHPARLVRAGRARRRVRRGGRAVVGGPRAGPRRGPRRLGGRHGTPGGRPRRRLAVRAARGPGVPGRVPPRPRPGRRLGRARRPRRPPAP